MTFLHKHSSRCYALSHKTAIDLRRILVLFLQAERLFVVSLGPDTTFPSTSAKSESGHLRSLTRDEMSCVARSKRAHTNAFLTRRQKEMHCCFVERISNASPQSYRAQKLALLFFFAPVCCGGTVAFWARASIVFILASLTPSLRHDVPTTMSAVLS